MVGTTRSATHHEECGDPEIPRRYQKEARTQVGRPGAQVVPQTLSVAHEAIGFNISLEWGVAM
jgi:hypothetical protein